jgi:hypothetical protein
MALNQLELPLSSGKNSIYDGAEPTTATAPTNNITRGLRPRTAVAAGVGVLGVVALLGLAVHTYNIAETAPVTSSAALIGKGHPSNRGVSVPIEAHHTMKSTLMEANHETSRSSTAAAHYTISGGQTFGHARGQYNKLGASRTCDGKPVYSYKYDCGWFCSDTTYYLFRTSNHCWTVTNKDIMNSCGETTGMLNGDPDEGFVLVQMLGVGLMGNCVANDDANALSRDEPSDITHAWYAATGDDGWRYEETLKVVGPCLRATSALAPSERRRGPRRLFSSWPSQSGRVASGVSC